MKIQSYTIKGVKAEDSVLPKELSQEVNLNLLAQAVYVYENKTHIGLRNTKTRSEINRTTKKVYKQKGTGGARHGSKRANLFVGGGVIFGPRPVKRALVLPAKIRSKAKNFAFLLKAKENKLVFIDGIEKLDATKTAGALVKILSKETKSKKFAFILSDKATKSAKFINNIKNTKAYSYKHVTAYDIVNAGVVLMDSSIFTK